MAHWKFKVIDAVAMFDLVEQALRMIGQGGGSIHIVDNILEKAGVSCH